VLLRFTAKLPILSSPEIIVLLISVVRGCI